MDLNLFFHARERWHMLKTNTHHVDGRRDQHGQEHEHDQGERHDCARGPGLFVDEERAFRVKGSALALEALGQLLGHGGEDGRHDVLLDGCVVGGLGGVDGVPLHCVIRPSTTRLGRTSMVHCSGTHTPHLAKMGTASIWQ